MNGKIERSDEQKMKRGRIALVIIAIMAFSIIVFSPKQKDDRNEDPKENVKIEMDKCLDSLLNEMMEQSCEVYFKAKIESVPIIPECPEEIELKRVDMKIRMLENTNIPAQNREEELQNAYSELSYLEKKIEEFYEGAAAKLTYDSRRIKFRTDDGKKYTCFQQNFMGRKRLMYLQEITRSDNAQKDMERLKKETEQDKD